MNANPSVSKLRRDRERAELKERMMDVAREMFVRDGYEAVTLRSIALAIEYSPGFVYKLFKDKQTLVMEIIRKDSHELRSYLAECSAVGNPVKRIVEAARRYAAWGVAHPNHYRLMLVPPPAWVEQDRAFHEQEPIPLEQELLSFLQFLVKEAMRLGLLKEKYTEPALVAATLWAGLNGVVVLEITMTPRDRAAIGVTYASFEARLRALEEVFLDGFLKEGVERGESHER
jgi:AcrR family transcriptional regulator